MVDEPIYRRLPCFLIATVDKFAAMPWRGEVASFFGRVKTLRPGTASTAPATTDDGGRRSTRYLPPPDLVIQDELHLISGPLGTMVGLYETAIDEPAAGTAGDEVRPKIVASTATVRRAEEQIRALFGRTVGADLPAARPGPPRLVLRRDASTAREPARLYLGVAAQGRSPKVVLLQDLPGPAVGGRRRLYEADGGKKQRRQSRRPLHDAARLLQQPPRAGRQPPHRSRTR